MDLNNVDIIIYNHCSERIISAKERLALTDYKVIKNYEAAAAGKNLIYDPNQLYIERQKWRNIINDAEERIQNLPDYIKQSINKGGK